MLGSVITKRSVTYKYFLLLVNMYQKNHRVKNSRIKSLFNTWTDIWINFLPTEVTVSLSFILTFDCLD